MIAVPGSPTITGLIQMSELCERDELVIVCVVEGFPSPFVTWTKDNTGLRSQDITLTQSGVAEVSINSPSTIKSGIYACNASNIFGSVTQEFVVEIGELY